MAVVFDTMSKIGYLEVVTQEGKCNDLFNTAVHGVFIVLWYLYDPSAYERLTFFVLFLVWFFVIDIMSKNRLNTRRSLRGRTEPSDSDHPLPVLFPSSFSRRSRANDRFRTVNFIPSP